MAHYISNFLKRNWRVILNIITLGALGALVFAIHGEILDTFHRIKHVHWWALLLIVPIQVWNYDSYVRLYRTLLRKLGHTVSYKALFRISLELNFVNHVFPSGGISGFSYFSVRMKKYGVGSGTATVVQLLRFFMGYLGFLVLLVIGIFSLAIMGKANNFVIMVATFLATLIVFGTLLVGYIVGDSKRINTTSAALVRGLNRVIGLFRRGKTETISLVRLRNAMDEMHRSYITIQENRSIVKQGVWFGFLTGFTELMTIYVVYIAFGEWVNIGAVILAYAIANFAGLISVLPGGVGMYEALMTGVLAIAGVPPSVSIPVTVMYRVLGISVQIIPGWILYQMALRKNATAPNE